jgi:hypothetical protein
MTGRRRLSLLIFLVVGFVALVALVAHGRPLGASAGRGGLPASFWSYVFTTAIILLALGAVLLLAALLDVRLTFTKPKSRWVAKFWILLIWLTVPLVALYLRWQHHRGAVQVNSSGGGGGIEATPTGGATSGTHFVLLEAVIVAGVIAVTILVSVAIARRNRVSRPDLAISPEAVAEALDESVDDLRTDPDLRRAIVAAYARMEQALRVTGLPRRPAEAPLEYVERALLTLDTSGPSVRRLTDLFEWAKFSHHEPEPAMRDEAIDALAAVRDELRAPVEVPA